MKESTGRVSILTEAETLINGPRRESYGDVRESFVRLARLFNEVLQAKLTEPITPHESALLLVALKLSREIGKPSRDNRIDGAAYFDLADQVAGIERKQTFGEQESINKYETNNKSQSKRAE